MVMEVKIGALRRELTKPKDLSCWDASGGKIYILLPPSLKFSVPVWGWSYFMDAEHRSWQKQSLTSYKASLIGHCETSYIFSGEIESQMKSCGEDPNNKASVDI